MAVSLDTIVNALNTRGVNAFGFAMPVLSPAWTKGSVMPTANDNFSLRLDPNLPEAGNSWLAPAA